MIKIEIKSGDVTEEVIRPSQRPGAKQFEPFTKRFQLGYVQLVQPSGALEPYPTKVHVNLQAEQPAYVPGIYELAPESAYVDRNHNLTLGWLKLRLVRSGVKAAA